MSAKQLYALMIHQRPILRGAVAACYAAAWNLGLATEMLTQDGTRIAALSANVSVREWNGDGLDAPPLLTCNGVQLVSGEPLPALHDLLEPRRAAA